MEIRDAHPARKARDLRSVPFDRESDGSRAQDAEVVAVVGVLPDVLAREDQISPEGLLESSMKLVAPART